MKSTSSLPRRDWLKLAALTGAATILPQQAVQAEPTPAHSKKRTRGVIFMVSDGMSPGVLTLAEMFSQLTRRRSTTWHDLLQDPTATCGLMDTASANSRVTDSAAASSAWGSGHRVNNGSINVAPDGTPLTPIFAVLKEKGALTGLVTTATATHATPAGFAASSRKRGNEDSIAAQYLNRVDIILGGGTGRFTADKRKDKRDLAGEFSQAGYDVLTHRDALLAAKGQKLLGTFYPGHLPYSIDRDRDPSLAAAVPTLSEMTEAALSRLFASGKPFLLQVEGARIDHAAHLNDIAGLIHDQLAFDDAIATVFKLIGNLDDILVVITSDHGNSNPGLMGMGPTYSESDKCFAKIARHTASHEFLFRQWRRTPNGNADQLTALVREHLHYTLKSDEANALVDIFNKRGVVEWNDQLEKPEGLLGQFTGNHTGIGWTGTTHSSDPTLVTAKGPGAEKFSGLILNKDVFGHLVELLG
ncbi:MAG: alkaline phosphatase [Luteolibacter sp.]